MSAVMGSTAPVERDRPIGRFVAFGLVIVVATGALTARLGYLQLVQGGDYAAQAELQRTVLEAVPSTRGLIYDRAGTALVTNVPTYSVKLRSADLPASIRQLVVDRLAALLGIDATEINAAIDTNPGSRFDLVRIATDVAEDTARIISESSVELPGVEVVVETRRDYPLGPLVSQLLGYTGPIGPEALESLRETGYLPDDLIGQAGVEASYEDELRGTYGIDKVERDATGERTGVLEQTRPAIPGSSLNLTIDVATQRMAEKAMRWGMKEAGLKRGVVIVMNPQTGEILALVSLPTYDNNLFARGISNADFKKLVENKNQPLLNHAVAAHYPPGSTYKLVAGTGALADKKITANTKLLTRSYLTVGDTRFYEWNRRGWGRCDLDCGFGHSADTYFFQLAGMLGIDRLAHWANQYGFGAPTGVDLPGEVSGIVPSNAWKLDTLGAPIYPGETYQAGIGQGYDVVTPIQLINAYAALANGGKLMQPQVVREVIGPDGEVARPFEPKLIRKLNVKPAVLREMREASRNVQLIHHTYNLVDLPIVMAGKSGTAEFGVRDSKGRLPFHSWFVAFVPKDPKKRADDPGGLKAVRRTDSNLVVLAFAYDSRTKGNAATEIVKYFLQQKYKIKKEYRNFDLLERGNFYQSN
ncbi:MAG TPA: penicillin-binding protein 2 [Candidatus Limnocylindrales bacterium]|nr:penicillin-binding protein 2 [Candidatus Limnocylindrales bacterium]